jgi:iron complex outermembrane recepter protein
MCAVGAVALCAHGTVLGQEVNNAAEAKTPAAATAKQDSLEEVVVTGIRAGLRSSLEVKRDSLQVIDAISAEDIGDFPDKNVGEALQRVTGVQISRQDGEGRGVSIRGADPSLNRVEINGSTALSETVGGGRDVDFRDIPVEFISRLEVVKSPTPEMTEGGLGGTVRVITRRPFDSREPYLAGSAQAVYSDIAESYDPKFALIGSRLFLDDTLGVLLSATYEKRHLYSDNARTTGWLRRAPAAPPLPPLPPGRVSDINGDGTLDWIPELPRYIIDRRFTKRPALSSVIEWRPNEDLSLYAEGTYAKAHEYVSSMFMQLGAANGVIDYANSSLGPDNNTVNHIELTSTQNNQIDLAYRNILGDLIRKQYTTDAGVKWNIGQFKLDARIAYSAADAQNNEINSTATAFGVPRAVIDYSGSERAPNISFPGFDVTTGQGINQLAAVFNPRTNTQDEKTGSFDVEYQPAIDWLTSLKAGAEYRRLNMDSIFFQRTITLSARGGSSGNANTVVAVPQSTIQAIIDANSGVNDIEFFPVGDLGFDNGISHWNDNGYDTYNATIAASGLTLDPYGPNANPNTNGTFQNYLDTWAVEEKTKGAYVQGSFRFGDLRVPISGTAGVRYVDTDTLSSGFDRQTLPGNIVIFPPQARPGGYSKVLPSMNIRFDLSPKLIGRITAAKVMARASPAQLAFRRTLDNIGLSGSRGNPDLKPFEAKQYDAGLEWYFSDEGYVSASYFRNEISSFIINTGLFETQEGASCDRATSPVACYFVQRPVNGSDRVTINGIEMGGQLPFTFLPSPFDGFGALANYTYQKDKGFKGPNTITGGILPFPGLSRKSYNVSLYFEKPSFSVRASYNWREHWLINPAGRGGFPEFNEDFGSLDATASYNITPQITAFVEGLNLLNEQRFENNTDVRRIGNELFGTRIFFGVRGKF